jgi:hypothetical protein
LCTGDARLDKTERAGINVGVDVDFGFNPDDKRDTDK